MNCDHCGAPIQGEVVRIPSGKRFCTPLHRFLWLQDHPEHLETDSPAVEKPTRPRSPKASDSLVVFRILLGFLYTAIFYFTTIVSVRILVDWLASSPPTADAIRGIASQPSPGEVFAETWGWIFLFVWIAVVSISVIKGWLPGTKVHPPIHQQQNETPARES